MIASHEHHNLQSSCQSKHHTHVYLKLGVTPLRDKETLVDSRMCNSSNKDTMNVHCYLIFLENTIMVNVCVPHLGGRFFLNRYFVSLFYIFFFLLFVQMQVTLGNFSIMNQQSGRRLGGGGGLGGGWI